MANREQLFRLCDQAAHDLGYALVDIEYVRESLGWVLRVFIDHPFTDDGPAPEPTTRPRIAHGDCARVSRQVSAVLDVENPIAGAYRLEVSSPGLKRRLRKEKDFCQFLGFAVAIRMQNPVEGRKTFVGQLVGAADGKVTVNIDGVAFVLPIDGMHKARLDQEY